MSDVPVWTCAFEDAPGGPKLDHLTVGAKFRLNCKGDLPVQWTADPLTLKFPKDFAAHALTVLNADSLQPQSAQLTVTAYRTGEHAPEYVRVLQNDRGFEIAKPKWAVTSVIKQDGKTPPQPYPSFGPWAIGLPAWIWIALAVPVALIVVALGWRLRRLLQRRRVRVELRTHRTALSPTHQFYRDARGLRRQLNVAVDAAAVQAVAADLDRDFRLFLIREFEVPARDWSDAAIANDLERRHRLPAFDAGDAVRKTLRELTRSKPRPDLDAGDVDQLLRMGVDAVERIEHARRRR